MRHVYVRGMLGLVWLAAAVVSGLSGKVEMAALYTVMSVAFLYFAYLVWKKEKDKNGGR